MLPKKKRLNGKEGIIRGGITFHAPYFLVKAKHSDSPVNRYAVVLGVRVSKSSVGRHSIKRHIMDELAVLPESFTKDRRTYDMIVVVSPKITSIPKERLRAELHAEFGKTRAFFEGLPSSH